MAIICFHEVDSQGLHPCFGVILHMEIWTFGSIRRNLICTDIAMNPIVITADICTVNFLLVLLS